MLTRLSNVTSFEYGEHFADGFRIPHTNISFHFQGEYYGSRVSRHLSRMAIEEEEERFIERRHRRQA